MKIKFIVGISFCLVTISSFAQSKRIKGLTIGDSVPSLQVANVINYSKPVINISDFKNKLLILDFGATWCVPCISALPKLDSLQRKFKNKVQIFFVTRETNEKVADFLVKLASVKHLSPPTLAGDTLLRKFFRFREIPYYVWIDGNQKVIAITEGKYVNEYNIDKILKGEKPTMELKQDIPFAETYPNSNLVTSLGVYYRDADNVLKWNRTPDSNVSIYSALTRYVSGFPTGGHIDSTVLSIFNNTIGGLYKVALKGNGRELLNLQSLIVDIPDSNLYSHITSKKKDGTDATGKEQGEALRWYATNLYTYELKVPAAMFKDKFKIMLEDLNRYFGATLDIEGVIEEKNRKYLALVRTTTEDKLATQKGKSDVRSDNFSLSIQNASLINLLVELAKPLQEKPFIIDETGYKGNIDIQLNCQLSDLNALNNELFKYGLQLKEKEKVLKTAVIRMKKTEN